MYLETQQKVREKFTEAVREVFGVETKAPALGFPPNVEMGEISVAACFELAKQLRQPPRKLAEQLAFRLLPIEGIERVSVAGAGYLNFHIDRASLAASVFKARTSPHSVAPFSEEKILVEHTSINPNKAAHIGHLRNAILGDTFVRLLRFRGHKVEIQNYIDNTGVQVADVIVGFIHLEKKITAEVRELMEPDPSDSRAPRFDYYCWDLYARVFQHYQENEDARLLRAEVLKAIEEGRGEIAAMADLVATAITKLHLETMRRVNVTYNLLVQESEILKLEFWKAAFELMKQKAAIRYEEQGKNRGCWVMSLNEAGGDSRDKPSAPGQAAEPESAEDAKVIVRSDGTVTYVGKDIAYHLWKFGLLGKDFGYEPFYRYAGDPSGTEVWRTAVKGQSGAPSFGRASEAYAVIDTRQSYLQNIVRSALQALGYQQQAARLHHFAYEVVGLTPRCAEELGVKLDEDDRAKGMIEVSGRKGLGVKADDLIDRLLVKAVDEVRARALTPDERQQLDYGGMIAVGALRYFLLKFSRTVIIAFDFKDALAFEGETGPYLQYSVVRARNIFRKFGESRPEFDPDCLDESTSADAVSRFLAEPGGRDFWELVLLAAQLEMVVDQAISAEEPAILAKYAFRLAQAFNNFYHRFHILNDPDPERQNFLLYLVSIVEKTLSRTVALLGIETPERM